MYNYHVIASMNAILTSHTFQDFVAQILALDPQAQVIVAGDFNEFAFVEPLEYLMARSRLSDLDVVVRIPTTERYTYLFDMNSQQLDHMYVSDNVRGNARFEHVHVNTWVTRDEAASDHDPSVARFDLCKAG